MAVQNIVWGVTQPFVGAAADRWGVRPIAMLGALFFGGGVALAAAASGSLAILLGLGVMIGISLSCTASAMAMSAAARPCRMGGAAWCWGSSRRPGRWGRW